MNIKQIRSRLLVPLVAVLLALLCGAVFILIAGANPLAAYAQLFKSAFGSPNSFAEMLVKMAPLLLCGLSMGMVFRTGTIALGAEGQIMIGGLCSAFVGVYGAGLPGGVLIPLCILAGMLGGALWALIPAYLYTSRNIDIPVNTIMFNYIAIYLVDYFIGGPFHDASAGNLQSPLLAEQAWFPRLYGRMHIGILLSLAAVAFTYWLMIRSPQGVKMQACGLNRKASRYAGIPVMKTIFLTLLGAGALAGLAGVGEIGGLHHRVMSGFSANYGWNAVAVALLGQMHPIGILASAFFWAALDFGANSMQTVVQVPSSLVGVLQAVTILFILASELWKRKDYGARMARWMRAKTAKSGGPSHVPH